MDGYLAARAVPHIRHGGGLQALPSQGAGIGEGAFGPAILGPGWARFCHRSPLDSLRAAIDATAPADEVAAILPRSPAARCQWLARHWFGDPDTPGGYRCQP